MHRPTSTLTAGVIAALACAFAAGCATPSAPSQNETQPDVPQEECATNELADVEHDAVEALTQIVKGWLETYKTRLGGVVEEDEGSTYLRYTFGTLPSVFNSFDFTVVIDPESSEVVCYGFLPTSVPENRREAMVEFLFRAEHACGLSHATAVLDEFGCVRCHAWAPFESFFDSPAKTCILTMGAVADKLWTISQGATAVILGEDPAVCASELDKKNHFGKLDEEAPQDPKAVCDAETKLVIDKCFGGDSDVEVKDVSDPWLEHLTGRDSGENAGVISAQIDEIKSEIGGIYDTIHYQLIVKDGYVWNISNIPDVIPEDNIPKAADIAMQLNSNLKHGLFCIDYETGKIWTSYSLPISVIPDWEENPPRNLYGAFVKVAPVLNIARNSETLHAAMAAEPQVQD